MSRRLVVVIVLLAIFASACARGEPKRAVDASPNPRSRDLPVPAESSADIKDKVFSVGQETFITEKGMVPEMLVSIYGEKISFINETSKPRTIVFKSIDFDSGPIEPGKAAAYTPESAYTIAYHVSEDPEIKGQVVVEPYYGPGEDPAAEGRYDADTPRETRASTSKP